MPLLNAGREKWATYGAGALIGVTLFAFLPLAFCNEQGIGEEAMEREQASNERGAIVRPDEGAIRITQRVRIPMRSEGGTYVIPVRVNGVITLDFTVDSGASDVTIPEDVVVTLIRTGTILDTDFIGEKVYILADGSKMKSPTFSIRSLQVGDRILSAVTASVTSRRGSLLLGQSFLGRFNSWSIDNKDHVLLLE
jgi:clan AA aspartic protease (TIGR02281 family)